MIIISLTAVLKVFMLLVAAVFAALVVLYPRNDQPTSTGQIVTFFVVMAIVVDVLFIQYFPFTIRFVP